MASFESTDISIEKLFRDFYVVPNYQREYVWSSDEVKTMLDDIYTEQSEDDRTEYFIGAVVVCPNEGTSNTFDLIDGQQRITTLFVGMCAIRDRMKELGVSLSGVNKNIADTYTDANGNDQLKAHLESQYSDSRNVLVDMINGEEITSTPTKSIKNIKTAYDTIYNFLFDEFGDSKESLKKFFGYLIHNVKIIRISTDSLSKALTVFETMNHRGVSLNHMDLLKNLVFMKTDASKYDELTKIWKDIIDNIHMTAGLDPTGFLRLFIIANWGVVLKKSDTYKWIQVNDDKTNLDNDPIGFAKRMLTAVKDYGKFRKNLNIDGSHNRFLDNIAFMDSKMRQHLIVLLSARHFNKNMFVRLCSDLESLIFVHLVCGKHGNSLEKELAKWCGSLASIKTEDEYNKFRTDCFVSYKTELSRVFIDNLMNLNEVKKNLNSYILAKLTQAIDKEGYDNNLQIASFCKDYGVHIEHILPQNPSEESKEEFGEGWDDPNNVNALGNLTLIEKSLNMSLGNKPFSEKKEIYAKSRFLLTKVIAEKPNIGNTAIDRAVKDMEPFYEWKASDINRRSSYLMELACSVWEVDNNKTLF